MEQIRSTLERRLSLHTFENLIKENPFVPKERKQIFLKGLNAGLKGDHLTCMHLLIPQIEISIRMILEQHGVLTTKLKEQRKKHKAEKEQDEAQSQPNLTQEYFDLNKILRGSETEKIFGEDMIFHLRSLLVSKSGKNYRNRLAHGLLKDNDFSAGWPNYLWVVTIKLCLHFLHLK